LVQRSGFLPPPERRKAGSGRRTAFFEEGCRWEEKGDVEEGRKDTPRNIRQNGMVDERGKI
jgi:hypothetical protein